MEGPSRQEYSSRDAVSVRKTDCEKSWYSTSSTITVLTSNRKKSIERGQHRSNAKEKRRKPARAEQADCKYLPFRHRRAPSPWIQGIIYFALGIDRGNNANVHGRFTARNGFFDIFLSIDAFSFLAVHCVQPPTQQAELRVIARSCRRRIPHG